jgi:4-carboxymuconolactone decarboxylase
VTIAAVLGTLEPLRGQLRIALRNGATPEQIVETFIQIEAYAGAARAFDGYRIAREVFAEGSAARSWATPQPSERARFNLARPIWDDLLN